MSQEILKKNYPGGERFSDERVVGTSVKVDLADAVLSSVIAVITGSTLMLAKILQGVSDVIVDGLAYIGMKRSKRPPTKKHPLGFGRELYIWSLFSTLAMFFILASLSFYFGFRRFTDPEPLKHVFLIFLILTVSFFINGYSFSLSFRRILRGRPFWKIKETFSQSTFLETKITFISDLMGVLAAVLGLTALFLFWKTGNLWFDGLGAMAIGFLMAVFSFWLFSNVRDFIIGVSAPDGIREQIKEATLEVRGVEEILDLKALVIGSNRLLVNLEVHIASGFVTEEIERLIDEIKMSVRKKVPSVYHIQVELETPEEEIIQRRK